MTNKIYKKGSYKTMKTNTFQAWMDENGYDDVRFYPRNTSAYGVSDMMKSASVAVTLYDGSQGTTYEDNVETFRETSTSHNS